MHGKVNYGVSKNARRRRGMSYARWIKSTSASRTTPIQSRGSARRTTQVTTTTEWKEPKLWEKPKDKPEAKLWKKPKSKPEPKLPEPKPKASSTVIIDPQYRDVKCPECGAYTSAPSPGKMQCYDCFHPIEAVQG